MCIFLQLQKGSVSSNSFSYERKPLNRQQETIYEDEATTSYKPSKYQSPIKSRLTVNPSEDNNSVTLTHTVSFYRRQQNMNSPSVNKVIQSKPIMEQPTTDDNTDDEDEDRNKPDPVEEKIKALKAKIKIENLQISQASNALNTCASTFEFSGSTESVVAEWKLLVASKFELRFDLINSSIRFIFLILNFLFFLLRSSQSKSCFARSAKIGSGTLFTATRCTKRVRSSDDQRYHIAVA